MISYLEKFNELGSDIRDAVSKKEVVEAINALEQEHKVSLATAVMRVMVKDISLVDLAKFFVFENNMPAKQAEKLVEELKTKVFKDVADYLGFAPSNKVSDTGDAPPAALVRSSNFYFSPEDEEEVKGLAQTMGTESKKEIEKKQENDRELLVVVGMISKELSFNFSSGELNKRFNNVILTYVKGIRNKLDTKSTLMKGVETGGLGLNEALSRKSMVVADRIMMEQKNNNAALDSGKEAVSTEPSASEHGQAKPDKDKSNSSTEDHPEMVPDKKEQPPLTATDRDMTYDFKALKEKEAPAKQDTPARLASEPQAGRPVHTVVSSPPSPSTFAKASADKPALDLHTINLRKNNSVKLSDDKPSKKPVEEKMITSIATGPRTASLSNGKKRVEDVKYVPKLTGPVDELKEMDIINFRRLNPDAKIATNKIIEKIKFLEDDSYEKRLAGIRAWRKSPANKLYLAIGQDSIDSREGIDAVIEERQANKEEYLTSQEFIAIMDMNKALRF